MRYRHTELSHRYDLKLSSVAATIHAEDLRHQGYDDVSVTALAPLSEASAPPGADEATTPWESALRDIASRDCLGAIAGIPCGTEPDGLRDMPPCSPCTARAALASTPVSGSDARYCKAHGDEDCCLCDTTEAHGGDALRRALELVAELDWPGMLEFVKRHGALPDIDNAGDPYEYEWKGDHGEDARYTLPARSALLEAVARAALAGTPSPSKPREPFSHETLRPCPFCGREPYVCEPSFRGDGYQIGCFCGAGDDEDGEGAVWRNGSTFDEAVSRWNASTPSPAPQAPTCPQCGEPLPMHAADELAECRRLQSEQVTL